MADREIRSVDDLQAAIAEDEARDRLELAKLNTTLGDGQVIMMSTREYARARGLTPQNVYYYIRNKRIEEAPCPCCGRKVINVEQADGIFVKHPETDKDEEP